MSKENKREIEEVYNYCLEDKFAKEDIENRHLHLNCEIDENALDSIVYHILRYNRHDKDIPVEERKPIIIYINSCGGTVVDGYGIIDAITLSETPVYTVNLATCFSMGLLIFMAGHKRFAMPKSEFLLHEGYSCGGGIETTSKAKDRLEFEFSQMSEVEKSYITSHSKISKDKFKSNYRKEWYFLPTEGKELGIVDYIVGTDCSLSDII